MNTASKTELKQDLEADARVSHPSTPNKSIDLSLLSRIEHKALLACILLQAFCYSFEVNLMYSCLGYVVADFQASSLSSLLPTIMEILGTVLVPFYAKVSDVVGRAQAITVAFTFYLAGYAVQGTAKVFTQFALGQIAYGVGSTGMLTLTQVLIADSTYLVDRGIMFALWDMPAIINVFLATLLTDPLTEAEGANWRNVYIIAAVVACLGALILMTPVWRFQRRTEHAHVEQTGRRIQRRGCGWLLQEYDAMGALLILLGLGLTLLPIIVAKTFEGNWKNPVILGLFFSGLIALALLTVWEAKFSRRPIMPMRIWVNRTCFGGLAIVFFLTVMNAFNYMYLGTYLVVSREITFGKANLLQRGYQVIYPLAELATGLLMKKFKAVRPFIWVGIALHIIGLGLQIPARKPDSSDAFVVISQVITGLASGMANLAATVAITGAATKKDMAIAIGSTQIMNSFGYALGSAIAGGIWTQYLPARLAKHVTGVYDEDLAMNDPLEYIPGLDVVTKGQLVEAYADSQMLLLIIAMVLGVLIAAATARMQHVDLLQDQPGAGDVGQDESAVELDAKQ